MSWQDKLLYSILVGCILFILLILYVSWFVPYDIIKQKQLGLIIDFEVRTSTGFGTSTSCDIIIESGKKFSGRSDECRNLETGIMLYKVSYGDGLIYYLDQLMTEEKFENIKARNR